MNENYKILVLSDLNKSAGITIKSGVALAKIIDADIDFFYVKKPTEVVAEESQLSAIRTINRAYFTIDKKIKNLIYPISQRYNKKINHSFIIGNIKNEITEYIDKNKPDIIVLGKQKSKILPFISDNITQFILKKHKGTIVISDNQSGLEPNTELSLGLFQNIKSKGVLVENIINATQKPLTYFTIAKNNTDAQKTPFLKPQNKIEYVFEQGDNTIKNISNYLSKRKINLLFISREKNNIGEIKESVTSIIKSINCSMILTN
jgi:nucleotide-binding universal stress UspA family protein